MATPPTAVSAAMIAIRPQQIPTPIADPSGDWNLFNAEQVAPVTIRGHHADLIGSKPGVVKLIDRAGDVIAIVDYSNNKGIVCIFSFYMTSRFNRAASLRSD